MPNDDPAPLDAVADTEPPPAAPDTLPAPPLSSIPLAPDPWGFDLEDEGGLDP